MVNIGTEVEIDSIKDFDIMLFGGKYRKTVSHVALYFNGNIYQSVNRGTVRDTISDAGVWNNYYKKRLKHIKRVVNF